MAEEKEVIVEESVGGESADDEETISVPQPGAHTTTQEEEEEVVAVEAMENNNAPIVECNSEQEEEEEEEQKPSREPTTAYPCIEQPLRVTLHCNGYYLWGLKDGRLIARKKRSEKDEFRLYYDGDVVTIQNHKYGGFVTVVEQAQPKQKKDKEGESTKKQFKVMCIPPKNASTNDDSNNTNDDEADASNDENKSPENEEADTGNEEADKSNTNSNENEEEDNNKKWCFVKVKKGVMLGSLGADGFLAVDNKGNVIFTTDKNNSENTTIKTFWSVECVTGELCFLSNPKLDQRLRCDMAGLCLMTDNWKGWEVFRFMEATHGYVKISSWMHSQWLLCSNPGGKVSTCTHAESFLDNNDDDSGDDTNATTACCKWAIEKSPTGNGVIIRSKTYGGLLCVKEGALKLYDPNNNEKASPAKIMNEKKEEVGKYNENGDLAATVTEEEGKDQQLNETKDDGKETADMKDEVESSTASVDSPTNSNTATSPNESTTISGWRSSFAGVQNSIIASISSSFSSKTGNKETSTTAPVEEGLTPTVDSKLSNGVIKNQKKVHPPPEETIVWQLEAAHLQNYYFSCGYDIENQEEGEAIKPMSIGPFPQVTTNLRKTDKFQMLLVNNGVDKDENCTIIRLYNFEKKKYMGCLSAEGEIGYCDNADDKGTEWTMKKTSDEDGGTVFQSRHYNLYLSYGPPKATTEGEPAKGSTANEEVLVGSETLGNREVWKLAPSMPRAVSSEKMKIFALGTSIAVGTSIAMPFAMAGMMVMLGSVGAKVGLLANVVAASLTGAEAIASVGAIGATAYIVFRPAENSLTDNHKDEDEKAAERPWSQRPFSNWRSW